MIQIGSSKLVWGVPSNVLTVIDSRIPMLAAIRFRFRSNEFAQVFVRTPRGISRWYIEDHEDHWQLSSKVGENRR
jgi:hypothetical protein